MDKNLFQRIIEKIHCLEKQLKGVVVTENTSSVTFSGDGTVESPLSAVATASGGQQINYYEVSETSASGDINTVVLLNYSPADQGTYYLESTVLGTSDTGGGFTGKIWASFTVDSSANSSPVGNGVLVASTGSGDLTGATVSYNAATTEISINSTGVTAAYKAITTVLQIPGIMS